MRFLQNYDPLGRWPLSTAAAALPVLTLFLCLVVLRRRVWVSAFWGLLVSLLASVGIFHMPLSLAAAAAAHGAVFGLTRFAWIVVGSLFLYNTAVRTGRFEVMKRSVAGLSSDPRLQLVLVAFCFGALLEGTGGGGAPVAIAGSFLIGLGFPPFKAATLCLVANTAPVAWGAVGTPIRVLAGVTGLGEAPLSAMTGRLLAPLSLLLPLWLVRSFVGWRQTREVLPALLVAGVSFAGMQLYWSNFQPGALCDVVSALFSLLTLVGFLRIWRPPGVAPAPQTGLSRRQGLAGWSPFLLASLFVFVVGMPPVARALIFEGLKLPMPWLHHAVLRMPPVVPGPEPESAIVDLNILALPGTVLTLAAIVAGLAAGLPLRTVTGIFGKTVKDLAPSLGAIGCMVALAFVTRYAGLDTVLGLSLTRTGVMYPFFGTLLGWLGVALTGTDAGSNALFGNLQKVTAQQLGLPAVLMAAANSAGGVMGKMIDAQSIVVAASATGQTGHEAAIFKAVFKHSVALATLVGVLVMLYAWLFPGGVPVDTAGLTGPPGR